MHVNRNKIKQTFFIKYPQVHFSCILWKISSLIDRKYLSSFFNVHAAPNGGRRKSFSFRILQNLIM